MKNFKEPKIFYINSDLIMFDEDTGEEFILKSDLEEFLSQFKGIDDDK